MAAVTQIDAAVVRPRTVSPLKSLTRERSDIRRLWRTEREFCARLQLSSGGLEPDGVDKPVERFGDTLVEAIFTNSMADLVVEEVVARLHMDEATNRSNLTFHRRVLGALRRRDPEAA